MHFIAIGGFSFTISDYFDIIASFRIDLSLSEAVPDHSTIWRFRQLLNTENLLEALLELFISIGVHFIAVGGFSFTISGYFDIIVGFRILSVIAIPTLAFA
jgi:hypothetical protein